jgi:spore coat polysaccharide biosynthesis predicted glycosyltransferase SpsG
MSQIQSNFFLKKMFDILVVAGFGKDRELGTGHLMRCLNIIKFLKKKKKIKKVCFVVNCSYKRNEAKKIINFFDKRIKIIFTNSDFSSTQLKNLNSKLLIIDTLSKLKNSEIIELKKKNKKIILLDDKNFKSSFYDLKINALIWNKRLKNKQNYYGYEFNIIPSFFKKVKCKEIKNKIFIFFGGYDRKNYTIKISKILSKKKFNDFSIFFENKYQNLIKNNNNFKFYDKSNFYKHFYSAKIIICSGGLIMFDSIYLNKITLCKSQYKHQSINIQRLLNLRLIERLGFDQISQIHNKLIKSKNQIFLTDKKIEFTLNRINDIYIKSSNAH